VTVIATSTVPRMAIGPASVEILAVLTRPLSSPTGMCAAAAASAAGDVTISWIART
jgi:hypothetical protein